MSNAICDINALRATVTVPPDSSCPDAPPGRYALPELFPGGMCVYLFNATFPYYVTLSQGGWFKWVPPGGGVVMQCPSPVGCVTTSVKPLAGRAGVEAEVVGVRSPCPKGHRVGDRFEIAAKGGRLCPKALGGLVPYLLVRAKGGAFPWPQANAVRCTSCGTVLRVEPSREPSDVR